MTTIYPIDSLAADPPSLYPDYVGTRLRAPQRPLIRIAHTLSELTGPVYGHESVSEKPFSFAAAAGFGGSSSKQPFVARAATR